MRFMWNKTSATMVGIVLFLLSNPAGFVSTAHSEEKWSSVMTALTPTTISGGDPAYFPPPDPPSDGSGVFSFANDSSSLFSSDMMVPSAIPEPSTIGLLSFGGIAFLAASKSRRHK